MASELLFLDGEKVLQVFLVLSMCFILRDKYVVILFL